MKSLYRFIARVTVLAVVLFAAGATSAQTNLVVNGGFEQQDSNGGGFIANSADDVLDWLPMAWTTATGYYGNLIAASTYNTNPSDWGGIGVLSDFQTKTPDGGNFLISDTDISEGSDFYGAISQQIDGLTVGKNYTLTFYQASSGVYQGKGGAPLATQWDVTFGNSTQSSPVMTPVYGSSTAWEKVTMSFTASSASQLLTFAGNGTPQGTPVIIATLDGVSLVAAVPEPATWGSMLLGLGVLAAFVATRQRRV